MDRQTIIRQLVERVIVSVQGESEKVDMEVHWFGGYGTTAKLIRPVAKLEQLSYYPQLLERVAQLNREGLNGGAIAKKLNAEGWRPPKRRETFTPPMVNALLHRQGLSSPTYQVKADFKRRAHEMTLSELALTLNMPFPALYRWLQMEHLNARLDSTGFRPRWLIKANKAELKRLRALRESSPKR